MNKDNAINSITVYDSSTKQMILHVFKDGDKLRAVVTDELDVEICNDSGKKILETKGGKQ